MGQEIFNLNEAASHVGLLLAVRGDRLRGRSAARLRRRRDLAPPVPAGAAPMIYFLTKPDRSAIKIGTTVDLSQRLKQLASISTVRISLTEINGS
jgi:hypothetical protein